jgi:hypothetical protein
MDTRCVDFGIVEKEKINWIYSVPYGAFCDQMYFDVQRAFLFEDETWQSAIARGIIRENLLNFIKSYFERDLSSVDDAFIRNYWRMNPNEEMQKIIELYEKYDDNTECAVWAWFVPG